MNPTESFVIRHIEDIADGYANFMHLDNWTTPKLGHRALWKDDASSRFARKVLLKAFYHSRSEGLHRKVFAAALKKSRPAAVLAEFGYSGAHILNPCRHLDIPLVVHFHGTDVNRRELVEKHLSAYKELFMYAKRLIAVSEHDKNKLMELGALAEKISIIPCGACFPIEYQPDKRPTGEYNIVSVTRQAHVKAPQLTLLAYYKYVLLGGKGHLHVIGNGPLLPFCVCLAKGLGISDKVTFHGGIQHDKVLEMLRRSHMYVQHSVVAPDGDCEGMPVSLMEAAGHGLPIVTTAPGGISEYIEHEKTAYVVDEYDVDGMAKYMFELWINSNRAEMMGRAAYIMAREQFDAKKQCEKLKRLIEST